METATSQSVIQQPSPTEEQWLEYKDFIRIQYMVHDISLKDVIKQLSCQGVFVTKTQMEARLKSWGMLKNLDQSTWRYIDHRIQKRKAQGKNSEVILSAKRLKPSNIAKSIKRHPGQSPTSPMNPYLTICTPPAFQMEAQWPDTLPWLRFRNMYHELRNFQKDAKTDTGKNTVYRFMDTALRTVNVTRTISQVGGCRPVLSVSQLALNLDRTKPEWYAGEHLQVAQSLLQYPAEDAILESLKMIIFQLSNAFDQDYNRGEWQILVKSLSELGLTNLQVNIKALSDDDTTMGAFLERLFTLAVFWLLGGDEGETFNLLEWLLKSGQDPNQLLPNDLYISGFDNHVDCVCHRVPVFVAVMEGQLELLQLLLKHGADINFSCANGISSCELILESYLSDAVKLHIFEIIAQHNPSFSREELLLTAIKLRDLDRVKEILTGRVNLTKAFSVDHKRVALCEKTALTAAVMAGSDFVDAVIAHIVQLDAMDKEVPFVTADTFIAAAAKGDDAMIYHLHKIDSTVGNICNQRGIKPVQVAVSAGHLSTCQVFLQLYPEAYSPTLLFLAASRAHEDILDFFSFTGNADPNAILDLDDVQEFERICPITNFWARFRKPPSVYEALLRLIGRYPVHSHDTALQVLIKMGARLTGGEVYRFVASSSIKSLLTVLEYGASANQQDDTGVSALEKALTTYRGRQGQFQIIEALLAYGARPAGGEVAAAIRHYRRDPRLLTVLLDHGFSLRDEHASRFSAFEAALQFADDVLMEKVLEVYKGHYDPGVLCTAAQARRLSAVEQLLRNRPSNATYDVLEATAAGLLARFGYFDNLHILIQYLTLDQRCTPAVLALERTSTIVVNRLLPWRSMAQADDPIMGSPLALAYNQTDISGFRRLLQLGFQVDYFTWKEVVSQGSLSHLRWLAEHQHLHDFPETPASFPSVLNLAVSSQLEHDEDFFQILLDAGADINEYSKDLDALTLTPLQLAVKTRRLDLVVYLLDRGANVNAAAEGVGGGTALQLAVESGDLCITTILLDRGAQVNAHGPLTALEIAAARGRIDTLGLLIHHGALITGNGRGQFRRSVKFASEGGFNVAAGMLKRIGNWSHEDMQQPSEETIGLDTGEDAAMELDSEDADSRPDSYCCSIIHNSDTPCVI
ncbi:sex-determining fem-1 [Fusarium longipes]|uniref:Sex-determining fem-1 n=1 Tax=Fusarium longipes TaxID=694270 RepID=A0A395T2I7_9HYPO|nr:sex-determining fem-1 [Fusarium longipes]